MQHNRVQGPTLVRTRDLLSHRGKETLRVEESCHPKHTGPAIKNPVGELVISLQELCEPETNGGRLPRDLKKWKRKKPTVRSRAKASAMQQISYE